MASSTWPGPVQEREAPVDRLQRRPLGNHAAIDLDRLVRPAAPVQVRPAVDRFVEVREPLRVGLGRIAVLGEHGSDGVAERFQTLDDRGVLGDAALEWIRRGQVREQGLQLPYP